MNDEAKGFPLKPTWALVNEGLKPFVRAIAVGDSGFQATLHDETGRALDMAADFLAGHPLALVFVGALDEPKAQGELAGFTSAASELAQAGVHVLVLPAAIDAAKARAAKAKLGLPFLCLSDPGGQVFAAYGLLRGDDVPARIPVRTVLLDRLRRIAAILDAPGVADHAKRILAMTKDAPGTGNLAPPHAPVLVIPGMLDARECQDLIALYNAAGDLTAARPREGDKDFKLPVYDQDRQDRVDHVIKTGAVLTFLDSRMKARVHPLVKKAFGFEVTRRENFHVARYTGPRAGTAIGHRDNTERETSYRRFALSVSLNDDFEGGALKFKEFTGDGYKGAPGTALVFSSGLLHEVEETTKGVRYTLISHLFSEQTLQKARSA
jgi:peroxiredoxin